ncbi:MAG: NYN domain-containing protein [Aggregatilineales bacterium]
MPYLIDGHNVIGQMPDISLDDPNDEALLVQKLIAFNARTRQKCVVVFDHGVPGGLSRMSTKQVQVVFAPLRSSADLVMIERIGRAEDKASWTVVSSDRNVLDAARRNKMTVMRSADFVALLHSPQLAAAPADLDAGEAADVQMSPDDVAAWLAFFNRGGPQQK